MTVSRATEWSWILIAFLFVTVGYAASQPINHLHESNSHEERGADGQIYHSMASHAPRELPPQGIAPFVYRLGTPLLVAVVAKSQDWVIGAGFDRVDLVFNLVSVILLTLLLQRHVANAMARVVVVAAFLVEPHSPIRFSYFHPLLVYPTTLTWLLAGLLAVDWFESRPGPARAGLVAVLVAIGVTFDQVMLVVGVSVLFCRVPGLGSAGAGGPTKWRDRFAALDATGAWLPLVCGVVTLTAIHAWVVATPSDYSLLAEALRWLHEKSVLRYGLAWFLAFGPLLVFPIYFWRRSVGFLRERPAWLAFLVMFAVLAWLGGGDTERLLVLASPVVYTLIARAVPSFAGDSAALAGLALLQALSSRVFSPIGGPVPPPQVGTEVWERLGWAEASWALSYENMWSQWCAPSMVGVYMLWYGFAGAWIVWFLWHHEGEAVVGVEATLPATGSGWHALPASLARAWRAMPAQVPRALVVLGTAAALAPVVWLAFSRFYWNHYDQPGVGYLVYNLARLWTGVVLLAAFWATGSRLCRAFEGPGEVSSSWTDHFFEFGFCGAAAWSIGVVMLAMLHLYYLWLILPLLTIAVAWAISDVAARRSIMPAPPATGWGLISILVRLSVLFAAAVVLLTIALWGNFGPDNDVPGNYLPYYETVLRLHSLEPNGYWVHFFVSKGHGLAFLVNILSDVQGAALASYLIILLGAGMLWRLAARRGSAASAVGLVGACLYLQFYAEQGAYAKGHITRNTFILYLVLSFARHISCGDRGARLNILARMLVIASVLLLSPLAIVLLVPILLIETALIALLRSADEARRSLVFPAWALAATALVCAYNYFTVGLPELHSMPSFVGDFVNLERLSRWLDPRLAFLDYRLGFLQLALPGSNPATTPSISIVPTQSLLQTLPSIWNSATEVLVGGSVVIAAVGLALFWWRAEPRPVRARGYGPVAAVTYLLANLALLAGLRMFGGGEGSSMGRFTDFATPIGIALGVVVLSETWTLAASRLSRGVIGGAVVVVAGAAIYLGSVSLFAQQWQASADFLIGKNTYARMTDGNWGTVTARRLAAGIPPNKKVEMLNFLPGFTAIPDTPFQRPDGSAYLKDYTTVLYGSETQAADIFAKANIDYFLVDLSADSAMVWSAFSPLFAPASIRSRLRLVSHDQSDRYDFYLLTWNRDNASATEVGFEEFLRKWTARLDAEAKRAGVHWEYEKGSQLIGIKAGQ